MSVSEEKGRSVPERKVSFRLTNEEYDTMFRIADMLHKNGSLKFNTVNALAKAACFTQINIYLQIEAKDYAMQRRKEELDKRGVNERGYNYEKIPNIGQY